MKKIFISLIVAAASFMFVGCEGLLDNPRKGVVDLPTYYKTNEDAQSALVAAYYTAGRFYSNTMWTDAGWNDCPFLSMWEYATDEIYVAGSDKTDGQPGNEIQSFRADYNNTLIAGTYECYYMIIKAANDVIDHFDGELADTEIKKQCLAEARILRAQAQLLLALGWGTAPIVDHNLSADDKLANASSQDDVLQWVADECDKAIPSLKEKKEFGALEDDKYFGYSGALRVTKEYAYALKGKALISKHDYSGAKAALKMVIDSKQFALIPGEKMASLNHNSGRASSEAVFELNFNFFSGMNSYGRTQPNFRWLWSWRSDHMNPPTGTGSEFVSGGWGWVNPSQKFVDKILAYDGEDSYRRKAWIKSYDEVLYDMPYLSDADCPTKEAKEADPNRGIKASGIYGNIGYFMWKRLFRNEDRVMEDGNVANWNLTIMRYAEVLLLYAECCAQDGDSDGSGLAALKLVNERAGSKTPVTKCDMATVKSEKFLECWLDGTRFQDLIRWGDAAQELAANGSYYPTYYDKLSKDGAAKHEGYIDATEADWCAKLYNVGFKPNKSELFPFPLVELDKNPNLVQNPGY